MNKHTANDSKIECMLDSIDNLESLARSTQSAEPMHHIQNALLIQMMHIQVAMLVEIKNIRELINAKE